MQSTNLIKAIFKRIDQHLGEWIEKETELLVPIKSKGEEIPGIIVGGDIVSDEQISGKGGKNSPLPGSSPAVKAANGDSSLQDLMHAVVLDGGLFNIVKGAEMRK